MKTKTIEMWISKKDLYNNESGFAALMHEKTVISDFKIKVTYEIEEPKIEITPSRLREALSKASFATDNRGWVSGKICDIEKELFGEIE